MSKVTEFFGKEQTHICSILPAPARGGAPGPRPRYVKAMTSRKSPLELAALATAAVPGMRVTALRPPTYSDELSTVTGIEDAGGHRWIVTSPTRRSPDPRSRRPPASWIDSARHTTMTTFPSTCRAWQAR